MRQILYTSRASEGDAGSHLPDILFCSRRNNPELGVTGILLVHGDHFLQLLEFVGVGSVFLQSSDLLVADFESRFN